MHRLHCSATRKGDANLKNFPDYEIDKSGVVKNIKTGRILHQYKDKNGYMKVALYRDRKQFRLQVHRLVAEEFIPNPEAKPQVNHIDGNKENNAVKNLEWCTLSENQIHRRYVLKIGNRKVKRIETNTVYDSVKEAAENNGSYIPNIVRACKNNSTAAGFHWSYVD